MQIMFSKNKDTENTFIAASSLRIFFTNLHNWPQIQIHQFQDIWPIQQK